MEKVERGLSPVSRKNVFSRMSAVGFGVEILG
jgi:hypothetical protein